MFKDLHQANDTKKELREKADRVAELYVAYQGKYVNISLKRPVEAILGKDVYSIVFPNFRHQMPKNVLNGRFCLRSKHNKNTNTGLNKK